MAEIFNLLALIAATGSFLLFVLEPMFAKMILPTMGGSANVWIAATMFYQLVLFIGYAYVCLLSRCTPNMQWRFHITTIILASFFLPFSIPDGWSPSTDVSPVLSMILVMVKTIGLPFIILSATAPLLQHWYSTRSVNQNPYNLYSYSNLGSFLALICYPLIIEPNFFLMDQSKAFAVGYVLWGMSLAVAGLVTISRPSNHIGVQAIAVPTSRVTVKDISWWIFLSAIPTSLMLSTTSFITIDIGAAPLFWVIPLGIYLLTYVIAFSKIYKKFYKFSALIYPYIFVAAIVALVGSILLPAGVVGGLFFSMIALIMLAAASLLCNCRLSDLKPDTFHSMIFYLSISLGGVFGGFFNAVIAPLIFPDVYEYPLALILACAALPTDERLPFRNIAILCLLALIAPLLSIGVMQFNPNLINIALVAPIVVVGIIIFSQKNRPQAMVVSSLIMFLSAVLFHNDKEKILSIRNFYGVVRVSENSIARILSHGTTIHGIMALDQDHRLSPLSYYSPQGGLGEATHALNSYNQEVKIAVIGLGTGALKCYGKEAWHFDFYEIDPSITNIASNQKLFPYLTDCPAKYSLFLGDGRLNIKKSIPHSYDEIVVDAFSSDSIPVHLITIEAVQEFSEKIKDDGILLFHLSNKFLDLVPVVAAISNQLNLNFAVKNHFVSHQEGDPLLSLQYSSIVAALSPSQSKIDRLKRLGWVQPEVATNLEPWRDGKSNLISALSWERVLKGVKAEDN